MILGRNLGLVMLPSIKFLQVWCLGVIEIVPWGEAVSQVILSLVCEMTTNKYYQCLNMKVDLAVAIGQVVCVCCCTPHTCTHTHMHMCHCVGSLGFLFRRLFIGFLLGK